MTVCLFQLPASASVLRPPPPTDPLVSSPILHLLAPLVPFPMCQVGTHTRTHIHSHSHTTHIHIRCYFYIPPTAGKTDTDNGTLIDDAAPKIPWIIVLLRYLLPPASITFCVYIMFVFIGIVSPLVELRLALECVAPRCAAFRHHNILNKWFILEISMISPYFFLYVLLYISLVGLHTSATRSSIFQLPIAWLWAF